MDSALFYQISQAVVIIVLSIIGLFLCISQNWFKKQAIFTMLGVGLSLIVVGFLSGYSSGGKSELLSIMFLQKFSMSGRLLLMGYSGVLTGIWLAVFNIILPRTPAESNGDIYDK